MTPALDDIQTFSFAGQASEPSVNEKKTRTRVISYKGGVALLICFLIGIAAAALLLYTLL